jgi:hypothetical protein
METNPKLLEPEAEKVPTASASNELTPEQRKAIIWSVVVFIVLLLITIGAIIFLLNAPMSTVARIRDIFIIFMAIQSLLTGFVLVILIIQVARLINLLQNEIKPILESTNETVSTLRGTATFLSDNFAGPVIKMNEYLAGLMKALAILGLTRRNTNPKQKE